LGTDPQSRHQKKEFCCCSSAMLAHQLEAQKEVCSWVARLPFRSAIKQTAQHTQISLSQHDVAADI